MIKYETVKMIDSMDWDNLVIETYDKPYCFQQQNGCQERGTVSINIPDKSYEEEMNDSIPEEINGNTMGVKFSVWLARDPEEWNGKEEDKRFVRLFWNRNFYPNLQTIANDLHSKGLIEKGYYEIKMDW